MDSYKDFSSSFAQELKNELFIFFNADIIDKFFNILTEIIDHEFPITEFKKRATNKILYECLSKSVDLNYLCLKKRKPDGTLRIIEHEYNPDLTDSSLYISIHYGMRRKV